MKKLILFLAVFAFAHVMYANDKESSSAEQQEQTELVSGQGCVSYKIHTNKYIKNTYFIDFYNDCSTYQEVRYWYFSERRKWIRVNLSVPPHGRNNNNPAGPWGEITFTDPNR